MVENTDKGGIQANPDEPAYPWDIWVQKRLADHERRLKGLEWLARGDGSPPVDPEKAMMLLDNIASAESIQELMAWQKDVREFLGLSRDMLVDEEGYKIT